MFNNLDKEYLVLLIMSLVWLFVTPMDADNIFSILAGLNLSTLLLYRLFKIKTIKIVLLFLSSSCMILLVGVVSNFILPLNLYNRSANIAFHVTTATNIYYGVSEYRKIKFKI